MTLFVENTQTKSTPGRSPHAAIQKEIDSEVKRLQGLCPLTPEEITLVLKSLGFTKDTLIYIASGEIYGGERRLAALRRGLIEKQSGLYFNILSISQIRIR